MERLTYEKSRSRWNEGRCPTKYTSRHTFQEVVARLAAYEDTGLEPEEVTELMAAHGTAILELSEYRSIGPAKHFLELAQAKKDGRLVVLEPAPAAKEGVKKPTCFYNDMGQEFCLGFGRGRDDDEPIDTCKECWYCEFSSFREEAEAALKKREG